MAAQAVTDAERCATVAGHKEDGSAHAVDAAFQLGFVIKLGLAVVCGAAVAGMVAYAVLAKDLGSYAQNVTIISRVQRSVAAAALLSALIQVGVTGLIVTVLVLLASHKIAGPTVRLVRMLREVREGKLPGLVRFRRDDQVGKLETRFNEVSCMLSERHEHLRRRLDGVRSAGRELRYALRKPEDRKECRAAAKRLRDRASELASSLAAIGGKRDAD